MVRLPDGFVGLCAALTQLRVPILCLFVIGATFISIASSPDGEICEVNAIGTLPIPTIMHGSAVVGSRLYVFGGHTKPGGWTSDVWSARIAGDDRLEEWRNEVPLPGMRAYFSNSLVVSGQYIYIFGGSQYKSRKAADNEGLAATDYLWTEAGKDGVLEPWKFSSAPPNLRASCAAACTTGSLIFVVGGNTGNGYNSSAVEIADISADGRPVNWRTATSMPTGLWFHGAGIADNFLYIWGGLPAFDNNDINQNVWRSTIGDNGTLGEWTEQPAPPSPSYSSGHTAVPGYLVTVGGRLAGGLPINDIEYARLVDGNISDWKVQPTSIRGRVYLSLAPDTGNGRFFLTGGMDKRVAGYVAEADFPSVDDVTMCDYKTSAAITSERLTVTTPSAEATLGSPL